MFGRRVKDERAQALADIDAANGTLAYAARLRSEGLASGEASVVRQGEHEARTLRETAQAKLRDLQQT